MMGHSSLLHALLLINAIIAAVAADLNAVCLVEGCARALRSGPAHGRSVFSLYACPSCACREVLVVQQGGPACGCCLTIAAHTAASAQVCGLPIAHACIWKSQDVCIEHTSTHTQATSMPLACRLRGSCCWGRLLSGNGAQRTPSSLLPTTPWRCRCHSLQKLPACK